MSHYAITITRQFGSLGRPIAKELSERLGIHYYDRDIVEGVAKRPILVLLKSVIMKKVLLTAFGR